MVSILETQVLNFIVHVVKVADVASLFDIYLNTCPGQGSRTIRTEEAVLISLQYLQDPIMRALDLPFPP
jgi:predicted SPOUT superfamily RNA methylase MTH1